MPGKPFYWPRTPAWLMRLFTHALWHRERTAKTIYLTFDDGPVPEVTPWVLEQLQNYRAQATFFMVGDNIRKHPELFARVKTAGHRLANHTFHHLDGWQTPDERYFADIAATQKLLADEGQYVLFRPPYGRLTYRQYKYLSARYRLVMWDVLSGDFDRSLTPERCLARTIRLTRPGSVVVFHDSPKTQRLLHHVLPEYLAHFSQQGYNFKAL